MTFKLNRSLILLVVACFSWMLISCQNNTANSTTNPIVNDDSLVETPTEDPPTPPPDTLIICLSEEPGSLYPYGDSSQSSKAIREAIFDGPYDTLSYEPQAVILEKMPSFETGDVSLKSISVSEGDLVLSDNAPRTLEEGISIRPSGCLAEDCELIYTGGEIEMDLLEVQFTLLPELLWSDGKDLTAGDSVYAFDLASHPDTPIGKAKINRTSSYLAIDDLTVEWTGIPGYLDPNYADNFWAPMPEHLWGALSPADLLTSDISTQFPIGWGAYMVEEWNPGQSILLSKNSNYFRSNEGYPYFDTLVYRFVGQDADKSIDSILSSECDLLGASLSLMEETSRLVELQDTGELFTSFSSGNYWEVLDLGIHPASYDDGYSLFYGDRPDYFGDVRVRQAIASCLDRQKVVDDFYFGQSTVLDSYLSPQHPLFNANINQYPFDTEKGMVLLEQAGWVLGEDNKRTASGIEGIQEGTILELDYWTTAGFMNLRRKAAEKFAANLTSCGIQVNLEILSTDELYAKAPDGPLFGRQYEMVQYPWQIGQTPPCNLYLSSGIPGNPFSTLSQVPFLFDTLIDSDPKSEAFPWGWGGWNTSGYVNPAYDAACSSALNKIPGMPDYENDHMLAQEIFAEDLPVIPLYLSIKVAAAREDICNFTLDATANSDLWNIEEIAYGVHCETD
ncbi:MAG: hypothetical protein HON98_04415 [Chloroflexi bacterium]|jgi:peptide/nickel transport system substrate-binding protein|nr:hypothetical protein [Chloroflexota bacterium]MBT3671218.1 hypothetical protein [Chloroflexota bacterium]MBT4003538.1 hypothetical protein [Chloroflexota bacterium]MBT4304323.1 hypothetical protein [Chloroflexota bacterium]MBT4534342.1 hypothetical protein [Chloroflexota bacterium]